jgi:hypothetical protein
MSNRRRLMARRIVWAWWAALTLAVVGWSAPAPLAVASTTHGNLTYFGGPVLHSSDPYIVFWMPAGESISAASRELIERYVSDVAADSSMASDVFGVLRQYYDRTGFADARQTFDPARQVILDTHEYPAREGLLCPEVSSDYGTCIADDQIQRELQRLVSADQLPTAGSARVAAPAGSAPPRLSAGAPIYLVILPADVEVCVFAGIFCTGDQIWAYHESFVDTGGGVVLYAPLPLWPLHAGSLLVPDPKGMGPVDGTSVVQSPNHDVNTDLLINDLSHEESETITDPLNHSGWYDLQATTEVADKCESYTSAKLPPGFASSPRAFRPTVGGNEPAGTLYTQLINGHPYYTQSEWSNGADDCEMRPSPGNIAPRFAVPRRNIAGAPLTFNPAGSSSQHPLSSATWNFGDGSRTGFFSGTAVLTKAIHRYARAGHYIVTLTLVDNRGNLKSTTRRITVHGR